MKYRLAISLIGLCVFFAISFHANAQKPVPSKLEYSIHYFIDNTSSFSIDQIKEDGIQQIFNANPLETSNFGFDHRPYWFRIELTHPPSEPLMLEINQPSLDYISVRLCFPNKSRPRKSDNLPTSRDCSKYGCTCFD